ncbi:TolC family protein [Sphingobacterium sp. UT-1RO-CII-1]|uniref:TolC family protein n=1 Tax=Sphingobacterium sp. UT-1RO-CII-1 TaxID=2995225 RepID=UPI00227AC4DF|nr:TolC family protein [Sphingobacterium sp. UT-1RO-CII-1]MCY4778854.1 TolC family protein [Sphingobacterium sp. UT-1RO-CII-1]
MKKVIYSLICLAFSSTAYAQSDMQDILQTIETNNSTLKALKEEMNAQKISNKTGIYLQNPEVEFTHLWGSPKMVGNEKDLNIKQTFDFATISGRRNELANKQNVLIDIQYKSNRLTILSEAKQYLVDYLYYQSLKSELNVRLQHAQIIAQVYKKRLEQGDGNILEYNKAQLNLSMIEGEMSANKVEEQALNAQLTRLNAGQELNLAAVNFDLEKLPDDFDTWYQTAESKNPLLAYIKQEIEVGKQQVSVNKALGMPNFSAGYVREKSTGQSLNGVMVGLSIPLWENKNRVKQAKLSIRAAEERQMDAQLQFYQQLKASYQKAYGLQQTATAYKKSLQSTNNIELLSKALNAGELSLLEYMVELSIYYENVNRTLIAERDYQRALAQLKEVEL